MAHKSKTQRAKATARKQARREQEQREAEAVEKLVEASSEEGVEEQKKSVAKRAAKSQESKAAPVEKKAETKPVKKKRNKVAQFFFDVKAEMKRVTWPTRQDVLRWSGVVVFALVFFGVLTAVLDNVIITPALVALSGLGA